MRIQREGIWISKQPRRAYWGTYILLVYVIRYQDLKGIILILSINFYQSLSFYTLYIYELSTNTQPTVEGVSVMKSFVETCLPKLDSILGWNETSYVSTWVIYLKCAKVSCHLKLLSKSYTRLKLGMAICRTTWDMDLESKMIEGRFIMI